mgnify:FL=1
MGWTISTILLCVIGLLAFGDFVRNEKNRDTEFVSQLKSKNLPYASSSPILYSSDVVPEDRGNEGYWYFTHHSPFYDQPFILNGCPDYDHSHEIGEFIPNRWYGLW